MRTLLAVGVRGLAAAGAVAGAAGVAPWSARHANAHHGFIGKHDFRHPLYLSGRVLRAYAGEPHARISLQVPQSLKLPMDRERMRPIEDAEARQTLTILTLPDRRGLLDLTLDRVLTRRLIDEPDAIKAGDVVEAIAYRRTTSDEYRHELHAVLLVLPDGQVLVGSSPAVGREPAARAHQAR